MKFRRGHREFPTAVPAPIYPSEVPDDLSRLRFALAGTPKVCPRFGLPRREFPKVCPDSGLPRREPRKSVPASGCPVGSSRRPFRLRFACRKFPLRFVYFPINSLNFFPSSIFPSFLLISMIPSSVISERLLANAGRVTPKYSANCF